MTAPIPSQIKLHRQSQSLELVFEGESYQLPAEYLRVYSPSAEVKGHGPGQEVLQTGKRDVAITGVEPQGRYAIKLVFSDGHDTGIYTWPYLYELSRDYARKWQAYLNKLDQVGASRDPHVSALRLIDPN